MMMTMYVNVSVDCSTSLIASHKFTDANLSCHWMMVVVLRGGLLSVCHLIMLVMIMIMMITGIVDMNLGLFLLSPSSSSSSSFSLFFLAFYLSSGICSVCSRYLIEKYFSAWQGAYLSIVLCRVQQPTCEEYDSDRYQYLLRQLELFKALCFVSSISPFVGGGQENGRDGGPLHALGTFHLDHRLVGLVVKASASRAECPGFESRLRRDFFGVESYQ